MQLEELRSELPKIANRSAEKDWFSTLEPRKKAELEFHNKNRDQKKIENLPQDTYELLHGNRKFYATTTLSHEYINDWMLKNVPGKVFLDYACGNGGCAIDAAQKGAGLAIGLDISEVSVEIGRESAKANNLENTFFVQGDCEHTGLPSNSIDTILCSGMLHHLDLTQAFPELLRILKPGGKILAVEALDYNPAIKLYRHMTPSMRTEWEKNHILSMKDIKYAKQFFKIGEIKFWHITSIGAALMSNSLRPGTLRVLNAVDKFLTKIPGIQLMSWQITFELIKPA